MPCRAEQGAPVETDGSAAKRGDPLLGLGMAWSMECAASIFLHDGTFAKDASVETERKQAGRLSASRCGDALVGTDLCVRFFALVALVGSICVAQ